MARLYEYDWDHLRNTYRKWFDNKLGRPIIPLTVRDGKATREPSRYPALDFVTSADFSVTPKQIIDRVDYELCDSDFLFEGYPIMYMQAFGAGVAAAFMGCELHSRPETIWFTPSRDVPITELHFEYNPDNIWLRRIKDVYIEGMQRWNGQVVMAMTDLGGVMDILASFRTTEGLLYDLYDNPDDVLRCVNELQAMWQRYFDEITDIIKGSQGYSSWAGIYGEKPTYILQSDFCYMISKEMFNVFVGPELAKTAKHLYKPFYHLDGMGELKHLDTLLAIDDIIGIQWVCGVGEGELRDWNSLYSDLVGRGKKIQAGRGAEGLRNLLKVVNPDAITMWSSVLNFEQSSKFLHDFAEMGIEPEKQ